ncbi:DUF2336 domain-containing protein [Falsiroseomonas sp.]|uniref:DUF2336 domain-containing protein n=1 Tax=Falsiroseomonas sp. TaxID=2870721 RepID=UPI002725ECCC|nr:DUF2336 domain-containing protein [Falsiroseomonas sp.]MDO9498765.1 DUF2336 domain-containing protein [Falsiroseomonas sp.]
MTDRPEDLHAARHGDTAARTAVARAPHASPELLTFLAADPAAQVRQAVAAHAATPPAVARLLAADADAEVRRVLAGRIAALAPELDSKARSRMARISAGTLAMLVEDTAVEVRAAIADAVRDMPDAPRELILRLARDTAMPVAEPVIRLSPLLTEADLLALIATPPVPATRRAVARRPALSETLSDAIAQTADTPAVAALLANPSAAIREATLDRLVAGAGSRPSWQAALVRRAQLPAQAARALGEIVTDHLLGALAARTDLPEGLAAALRSRVTASLAAEDAQDAEAELFAAAQAGDRETLLIRLAEAAGVSQARVEAALALRSGRAIAGLCHSAGWSATLAAEVQAVLGGLGPAEVVHPTAEGRWALGEAELQWQAELLEGLPA